MLEKFEKKIRALLKWSEKYTRTDMTYLAGGTFWLGIGKVITIISGLVLSVAFANLLPKEAFGTYQFVLSLAAVVSALTLTGMKTAILKEISRGFEGAIRDGIITHLKWSIGIALGGLALAGYYFVNDNHTLATSFLIVGAFAPFLESFKLYSQFFIGRKDFRSATIFGMWRKPLPIIALLAALWLTNDPVIIVLVYFASHTITTGFLLWNLFKKHRLQNLARSNRIPMMSFAKHVSIMNVIGSVAENLDKILLFHYIGAAEVAIYSFARMPQKRISDATSIIKTLAFPKTSHTEIGVLRETLPRKVLLYVFSLLIIVLSYIVAAPLIFQVLFPQYLDAVLFSQVLSVLILFVPFGLVQQVFAAHGREREMYIISISEKAAKVILLLALLPLYGIWGAISAVFGTLLIKHSLSFYLFFTTNWNTK